MMPETEPKADASPQPDLTGRTLGDFQILRRIGTGGMGQVYLARETSLRREVALKLLRGELNDNPTALARFQAEAQAVAKLNHPNIVHIHQIGEADGFRFMVLEFVNGRNLREYLARKGPPDLPITLTVMRQVASALQKAHDQGIVHRDIKPENILVTRKVEVKVTDFGLSRFFAGKAPATNLTQSGVTLGTPLYMSPEQVQGRKLDHRSDIYSFGVTCYHLLAGEPPFRGTSAFDVALKHVQEKPRPLSDLRPDLPADVCGMVHKMMAKNPDERYQSARDIVRELLKMREGLSAGGTTGQTSVFAVEGAASGQVFSLTESGEATAPVAGGRRWLWVAMACVLATAGGVGAAFGLNPPPETHRETIAAPAIAGLPDVRSPDKLTTTRERELQALLNSEGTRPEDAIKASIELGLLYIKERKLTEANDRFAKLASREREWRDPEAKWARIAGRCGQAVVLAHENKADPSNKSFLEVITEPPAPTPKFGPPGGGSKGDRSAVTVNWTLLRYPDLSAAVSDALDRNAANQNRAKLEPLLEQLRSPQRAKKD